MTVAPWMVQVIGLNRKRRRAVKKLDKINLQKIVAAERTVLVAVTDHEKYIFCRDSCRAMYGDRFIRHFWESPAMHVRRVLGFVGAELPREHQVIPSSGLGMKTSFIFWFPRKFNLENWKGKVISLSDIKAETPRKAAVLERAFHQVDKLLIAAA